MKEKKGKITITILILIIMTLVCFCGYLLYEKYDSNKTSEDLGNSNISDKGKILNVYISNSNTISIKTESANAKIVALESSYPNNGYVLYIDNELKLYDILTGKSHIITLDVGNLDKVTFETLESGFIYNDTNGKSGYYNIETNSISFKNKYLGLKSIDNTNNYLIACDKESAKVVNINSEKLILERQIGEGWYDNVSIIIECHEYENETFFVTSLVEFDDFKDDYIIYNKKGNVVIELDKDEKYAFEDFGQFYNRNGLIIYKEYKEYLVD